MELTNDKPLEDQLGCFGYYGFGSGFALSAYGPPNDTNLLYCNRCSQKETCWERHKQRCRELFPDLCKLVDRLAERYQGQELLDKFCEETQQDINGFYEPYMIVFGSNTKDGANLACDLPFEDRKEASLIWPLKPL